MAMNIKVKRNGRREKVSPHADEHHVELTYYTSDDGIWLECNCGWQTNLGWRATPKEAVKAEKDHLVEMALNG
jgi:hypothetical protein